MGGDRWECQMMGCVDACMGKLELEEVQCDEVRGIKLKQVTNGM